MGEPFLRIITLELVLNQNRNNIIIYYYYNIIIYYYNVIKQKMNVTRSLLEDIKTKQLKWCGHVQRMEEGRLQKKSYEMEPTRKKKTG